MDFSIRFSYEKDELLKSTRNIGFEEVLLAIQNGGLITEQVHHSPRWSHQRIYVVRIRGYVYIVPYVIDETKREIFLKTIYPSRFYTKQYLKGESS